MTQFMQPMATNFAAGGTVWRLHAAIASFASRSLFITGVEARGCTPVPSDHAALLAKEAASVVCPQLEIALYDTLMDAQSAQATCSALGEAPEGGAAAKARDSVAIRRAEQGSTAAALPRGLESVSGRGAVSKEKRPPPATQFAPLLAPRS